MSTESEDAAREDAETLIAGGYCRVCSDELDSEDGCYTGGGPGNPVQHVCRVKGWEVLCCGFPGDHDGQRELTAIEREVLDASPAARHQALDLEDRIASLAEDLVVRGGFGNHALAFEQAVKFIDLAARRRANVLAGRRAGDCGVSGPDGRAKP